MYSGAEDGKTVWGIYRIISDSGMDIFISDYAVITKMSQLHLDIQAISSSSSCLPRQSIASSTPVGPMQFPKPVSDHPGPALP